MSLFGSSPDESGLSATPARSNQKSSLFDDQEAGQSKGGSTLFNDDAADQESPWSMPTPRKGGNADPVKTLLSANDVPESYIDAYDSFNESDYNAGGGKVSLAGVKKLVEGSGISSADQDKVLSLVTGGQGTPLGRSEFNVLFALIGLSKEGEEVSLDSVDERRRSELYFYDGEFNLF